MSIRDLTGQTFGRLVAIGPNGRYKGGEVLWFCVCECWNTLNVRSSHLISRNTQSCGCLHNTKNILHGHNRQNSPSLTYVSWQNTVQRTTNPNHNSYKNYGARGIKVCDRWLEFENFLADMGERPSKKHSINRIDNNGNYEPGNCEWTTYNPRGQKAAA